MLVFAGYDNMIYSESLLLFVFILIIALFFALSRRKILFAGSSALLLFLLYFYRTPIYKTIGDTNGAESTPGDTRDNSTNIYSPCFGTVLAILPANQQASESHNCICIFLSPFDVHTQFMPADGLIISKEYRPGQFNPAYIMEKTIYNECMRTTIATAHGIIAVDQVAGQLVRRIVNNTEVGKVYSTGALIGMIKFGSMVRIFLPKNISIAVKPGDKVAGPETIIARSYS